MNPDPLLFLGAQALPAALKGHQQIDGRVRALAIRSRRFFQETLELRPARDGPGAVRTSGEVGAELVPGRITRIDEVGLGIDLTTLVATHYTPLSPRHGGLR
jgi:hypothetical protein